jgi:hypothetical protein
MNFTILSSPNQFNKCVISYKTLDNPMKLELNHKIKDRQGTLKYITQE